MSKVELSFDDPWMPEETYHTTQDGKQQVFCNQTHRYILEPTDRDGQLCRVMSQGKSRQSLCIEFQDGHSFDVPSACVKPVEQMEMFV